MAGMLSTLAEFERDIIREGVKAGIANARAHGRPHGRPRTAALKTKLSDRLNAMDLIARSLKISRGGVISMLKSTSSKNLPCRRGG